MKKVVAMVAIATVLCLLVGMSVLPNSASAQSNSEILLYYGNGGYDPGGQVDFYDLQSHYESQGYIVNYTDVWPSDFSTLCLIILNQILHLHYAFSEYLPVFPQLLQPVRIVIQVIVGDKTFLID